MSEQLAIFIDFENIALWAEREFFDFEITSVMEYLQSRGPAVVKRAYADWSRFSRYRDEMMNNSMDLVQIYSVRSGKNRADIRMAIDAFEIAVNRPQIRTFVIVSGDSDFSPLVAKLREYGCYTIGIGPRSITHHLLVKSCDEFIYLETALGEPTDVEDQSCIEIEQARALLVKSLQAHGQRGEVPILATKLKQTMLLMDPAFNEANFGYTQYKTWLEDNHDLVKLYQRDLQLYVAPTDYIVSDDLTPFSSDGDGSKIETSDGAVAQTQRVSTNGLYKQIFTRLKLASVDLATRRDVLRDIYRELSEQPGVYTLNDLLNKLQERYDSQGLMRNAATVREIAQLASRQQAFNYPGQSASPDAPIEIAEGITSEAEFVGRAESDVIYSIVKSNLDIDLEELAYLLLNDSDQSEYVQELLNDLKARGKITQKGKRYCLLGSGKLPFEHEPALQILTDDIANAVIPKGAQTGVEAARVLAKKAMLQRSQDFAASTDSYLLACRLQCDAVEDGEVGASLEDLRWYMASYASAVAGKLSQVNRDYRSARPYYLAFFALVQDDDPLWSKMRGLINPMLAYYWSNAGRELDINVSAWNLNMSTPAQIAVYAATYPNHELRSLWKHITSELARINPGLLRRIYNQLTMGQSDNPENGKVADQLLEIIIGANVA